MYEKSFNLYNPIKFVKEQYLKFTQLIDIFDKINYIQNWKNNSMGINVRKKLKRVKDKRRTTSHPCPVCGKTYVNEGSLHKHIASHPESASSSPPVRMWPCSVCQSVFSQEAGLLHHMENMRMEPKHQFAAQYVLSRAAAEKREKAATTVGSPSTLPSTSMNISNDSTSSSNNGGMEFQGSIASTSSHTPAILSASCSLQMQGPGNQ
ncbi:uncharacterized protein LOC111625135 [Centruroides sculpturatus]|uniref:uncharacterized protein LOC111625135 n=1 Tax=Centruroides sculpturatus TaxID=218467 RepID=UPI000C6D815A|nr:uncharacterized protein LOC111625135 [Centruroides sculpturatus]